MEEDNQSRKYCLILNELIHYSADQEDNSSLYWKNGEKEKTSTLRSR